ncbi:MAG: SPOR domain-containing protein [Pyrinomonadaceae bacterium]
MKGCPTCNRTYADETLTYCLADGSLLSAPYDPEATQRIPPPRITNAKTEVLPSPRSEVVRPDRNPLPTYIIIALLALIVGGGIVALLRSGGKDTSTTNPPASNSSNVSTISSTSPIITPKRESETEAKPTPTDSRSTSPPTRQLPQPSAGTWFVILGSFPKNDYEQANQRLQSVRGAGYDASIIDTNNYPGLRGGLWVVVMGPYSQSYAKSLVVQMKSVRSDAYIKSGW